MTNVSQLAALSNLNSDIFPLTSSEYGVLHECMTLLEPLKWAVNTAVRGAVSVGIQTVEVKKCLTDAFVPRKQEPLTYWDERRVVYPHLYMLAEKYDLLLTYAKS